MQSNEDMSDAGLEAESDAGNSFYRTIKTYVMRAGRMTSAQEKAYKDLAHIYCVPFQESAVNLVDVFGNTNPIIVEIGFGMGAATIQIAKENPNINYLGIEVHKPGVGRVLSEIRANDLKNLYIIEHDALDVLEKMIGDNSVDGFHVFFPDPWPKKKHHKRRLMRRPNTNMLQRKLRSGGYLYMCTDWEEYAQEALEELKATEGLSNKFDDFAPHQEWRPMTKFERKGLEAGREIRELFFVKKD
jgi:tRNA (guanine-N7-)-methyltransferase